MPTPGPSEARPPADRGIGGTAVLDRAGLDELIDLLRAQGYRVVGPTRRDEAIVLAELESGADLPAGWSADTAPGYYRLRRRADEAVFAHSAGAQSWKQFVHPPQRPLWTVDADGYVPVEEPAPRYAFVGVRACDLAAIAKLRAVLSGGAHRDPSVARRTDGLFVVAVGCTEPGGVCFCASMGAGPTPVAGFDLSLVERIDDAGHRFVVEVGSESGARVLAGLATRPAARTEVDEARDALAAAATKMGRSMPDTDLRLLMIDHRESAHWQDVAARCLECGNCTMVCPTCFCTTTEDTTDLDGDRAHRAQRWASCFDLDFSYVHGGVVRASGASRYRQWITHKLSSWHDQFGESGCVGCGRCIAWCPAEIDITAEAAALAAEPTAGGGPC